MTQIEVRILEKKTNKNKENKPIIETLLNTTAIALTGSGVPMCIAGKWLGFVLIVFGAGLEFFKYWGRKHNYWG